MGKGGTTEKPTSGLNSEYLQGLEYLRSQTTNLESELDKLKREFYACEANVDDLYEQFLKKCNAKLLGCNSQLRKAQKKLEVIDGELKLVELLNKMRGLAEHKPVDQEAIAFLTEFWETLKNSLETLRALYARYRTTVYSRLRSSCGSYQEHDYGKDIELTKTYTQQVARMDAEVEQVLSTGEKVIKTFENGVAQDLFTNTNFSDRILVSCDRKAFPILRVFPDLTEKLSRCCTIASQWINKDETYVHDIQSHIRETRTQAKQKESDLRTQKERQSELTRSAEEAFTLFKTNKGKLIKLESELQVLEEQMVQYDTAKKYKTDEKKQKEGIVSFLEISISQTKKNISLQLKRSRLVRQLKELEESLNMIEDELKSIAQEIKDKSSKKDVVSRRVEGNNASYTTLKSELEHINQKVEELGQEVSDFTESLTSLEIIQSFKTSPERVEDFYDKPSKVQLAPSLKEKIMMRKRKLTALNKKFLEH